MSKSAKPIATDAELPVTGIDALEHPRLIVVEGLDDLQIIQGISQMLPGLPGFAIYDAGGIDELLKLMRQLLSTPGRETLGFVADCNDRPTVRWQQLTAEMKQAGVTLPNAPDSAGTTISGTDLHPRVGIWMMPDNVSVGELEEFIAQMVPQGDPVWLRAQDYIHGIPTGERKFSINKMLRAQVHAWLAARERPRPLNRAVEAGDLEVTGPLCGAFVDWLRRLFDAALTDAS